jgi:hypothetical protein
MKVAIVGSRAWPDPIRVRNYIVEHVAGRAEVVTGGARGVDEVALRICIDVGVPIYVIPPPGPAQGHHGTYGQACAIRNRWIAEHCDRLVAFWDGASRGTAMTIKFAHQLGKPVEVITP